MVVESLSNLELKPLETKIVRTCLFFNECGKTEVYNGRRWQWSWCRYQVGLICMNHYQKLVRYPTLPKTYFKKYRDRLSPEKRKFDNKKYNQTNHPRRFVFKNRSLSLKSNPRKGYCSKCPNNIFDKSCKQTQMHHWIYIIILPWFGTEELCASCHAKETWKTRKKS